MTTFRAFRIDREDKTIVAGFQQLSLDDLTPGDVVVKVSHSSINYKDALAATGKGAILRRFPLNGGIDMAGTVVESGDDRYAVGDRVLATGCGLSETVDGGYSEMFRAPGDTLVPVPAALSNQQAMQLGTAGFTAALAVHRMEQNGQEPSLGPVVVTGATGGVGSLAIDMLAGRGYDVAAVTGKAESGEYLEALGAKQILLRDEIDLGRRPLEKAEWAGAVDNLGGDTLTWLTRTMRYGGNIASIGLAQSHALHTTVMPFILRAVCLLGINSVETPTDLRRRVWERIASDLRPSKLDRIGHRTIDFDELPGCFDAYIDGKVTGRVVVRIGDD